MARTPDQLVYQLEGHFGIDNELRKEVGEIEALTDPVTYKKAFVAKLQSVKERGAKSVKDKVVELRNKHPNVSIEDINDIVMKEAASNYQTELQMLEKEFPFRNVATAQAKATNIAKTVRAKAAAPKRKATTARKAPAKKKKTTKKTTKK